MGSPPKDYRMLSVSSQEALDAAKAMILQNLLDAKKARLLETALRLQSVDAHEAGREEESLEFRRVAVDLAARFPPPLPNS
jgi:hypothetical protein